ncbi:unnamed protein product, partial [Amoebophrya sp. A25]
ADDEREDDTKALGGSASKMSGAPKLFTKENVTRALPSMNFLKRFRRKSEGESSEEDEETVVQGLADRIAEQREYWYMKADREGDENVELADPLTSDDEEVKPGSLLKKERVDAKEVELLNAAKLEGELDDDETPDFELGSEAHAV